MYAINYIGLLLLLYCRVMYVL